MQTCLCVCLSSQKMLEIFQHCMNFVRFHNHYNFCILLNILMLCPSHHQENLKKWIKATTKIQNCTKQNHTKDIIWNQTVTGVGGGVGILALVFRVQFILRSAWIVDYFLISVFLSQKFKFSRHYHWMVSQNIKHKSLSYRAIGHTWKTWLKQY